MGGGHLLATSLVGVLASCGDDVAASSETTSETGVDATESTAPSSGFGDDDVGTSGLSSETATTAAEDTGLGGTAAVDDTTGADSVEEFPDVEAVTVLLGDQRNLGLGRHMDVVDLDGDGVSELVIGDAESTMLVRWQTFEIGRATSLGDAVRAGDAEVVQGDYRGIARAGDVDFDGHEDLAVFRVDDPFRGRGFLVPHEVWVVRGAERSWPGTLTQLDQAGSVLRIVPGESVSPTAQSDDFLGSWRTAVGDVDAELGDEILIPVVAADGRYGYVVAGGLGKGAAVSLEDLNIFAELLGDVPFCGPEHAGLPGDVDGDRVPELAIDVPLEPQRPPCVPGTTVVASLVTRGAPPGYERALFADIGPRAETIGSAELTGDNANELIGGSSAVRRVLWYTGGRGGPRPGGPEGLVGYEATLTGQVASRRALGWDVAVIDDVTGDRVQEVVVAAPVGPPHGGPFKGYDDDGPGEILVISGSAFSYACETRSPENPEPWIICDSGTTFVVVEELVQAGLAIAIASGSDDFGYRVAILPVLPGRVGPHIAVSSPGDSRRVTDGGAVHIFGFAIDE